jgi:hypothetical protein
MVKIMCEQCQTEGMVQRISNNYYRIRHYDKMNPTTKKPLFIYHKNSKQYIEKQLALKGESISKHKSGKDKNIDHNVNTFDLVKDNIDPDTFKNRSNSENKSGLCIAWLVHQLPKLTTRVQIPETAPISLRAVQRIRLNS